jgi:hypothetical protein
LLTVPAHSSLRNAKNSGDHGIRHNGAIFGM